MRALLLGAQGVFFNAFFLSYLFWPSACHRFVGALEEEAVHTCKSMSIHAVFYNVLLRPCLMTQTPY